MEIAARGWGLVEAVGGRVIGVIGLAAIGFSLIFMGDVMLASTLLLFYE